VANTDKEVAALISAWADSGTNPFYHYHKMSELHKTWPTLARAIEALVIAQGKEKDKPIE
jgi:hypothetical protein